MTITKKTPKKQMKIASTEDERPTKEDSDGRTEIEKSNNEKPTLTNGRTVPRQDVPMY